MNDILANVRTSLSTSPIPPHNALQNSEAEQDQAGHTDAGVAYADRHDVAWETYEDAGEDGDGVEFDDTGEGGGVEGDLDMEED